MPRLIIHDRVPKKDSTPNGPLWHLRCSLAKRSYISANFTRQSQPAGTLGSHAWANAWSRSSVFSSSPPQSRVYKAPVIISICQTDTDLNRGSLADLIWAHFPISIHRGHLLLFWVNYQNNLSPFTGRTSLSKSILPSCRTLTCCALRILSNRNFPSGSSRSFVPL